jgi:hypothetical protein
VAAARLPAALLRRVVPEPRRTELGDQARAAALCRADDGPVVPGDLAGPATRRPDRRPVRRPQVSTMPGQFLELTFACVARSCCALRLGAPGRGVRQRVRFIARGRRSHFHLLLRRIIETLRHARSSATI